MLWMALIGLTLVGGAIILSDDDDTSSSSDSGGGSNQEDQEIIGTEGADDLIGGAGDDDIFARESGDIVEGREGDDRIFGHDGDDALVGGEGDDFIRGGAGDDAILDNTGSDTIYGDAGNDSIIATSAIDGEELTRLTRDFVSGGNTTAQDLLDLFNFDSDSDDNGDTIYAGLGDDAVIAGDDDVVSLGEGNDTIGVGDWMNEDDEAVVVTDFNPAEDTLVYSHDGQGPVPSLSLQTAGDEALLFADNHLVARIEGVGTTLSLADISIFDRTNSAPIV